MHNMDVHEAIVPGKLYSTSKIGEIQRVEPFGETKVFCKKKAKNIFERQEWIRSIKECFAQHVDGAVAWWQRGNISSSELLHLPEDEFQRKKASLLSCIDEFMQRYNSFQESRGGFRLQCELQVRSIRQGVHPFCSWNTSGKTTAFFWPCLMVGL